MYKTKYIQICSLIEIILKRREIEAAAMGSISAGGRIKISGLFFIVFLANPAAKQEQIYSSAAKNWRTKIEPSTFIEFYFGLG